MIGCVDCHRSTGAAIAGCFAAAVAELVTGEEVIAALVGRGSWPMLQQGPYLIAPGAAFESILAFGSKFKFRFAKLPLSILLATI